MPNETIPDALPNGDGTDLAVTAPPAAPLSTTLTAVSPALSARERQLAGLRPWKKGQSGNPGGRKKNIVTDAYRKYLKAQAPEAVRAKLEAKGYRVRTGAEAMAVGQLQAAMRGAAPCAKEMREAVEGKAAQRLEFEGADGTPGITVNIRRVE